MLAALPAFASTTTPTTLSAMHGDSSDADQTPATGRRPLRELAEDHPLLVGSAVDTTVLAADAAYRSVLAREFSSLTPENVMKWQLVEPRRGQLDFGAAERLVQFARRNGQLVRGHTLVWHNQLPSWLSQGSFSSAELADLLHQHIQQEASHFRGQIYAWDVVNEPFNDDGSWRNSIWFQAMGPEYVAQALSWAHEADPQARLYINDYNLEPIGPKSDAMYTLVQDLIARGVPVDGVGFQGHLSIQFGFPSSLDQNLERFTQLGVDVAITEADVRMQLPADSDKLAKQADYFAQMLQACLAVPQCVSYTVWGFTDAHSWVPTTFNGQGAATPFDEQLQPKPAYFALSDLLGQLPKADSASP